MIDSRYTLVALAVFALEPLPSADGDGWTSDFQAAKAQAKKEGKDLLLEFTGSDWCSPCIRLTNEVFSKQSFIERASEQYVLVVVDNPRGEDVITKAVRKQNDALHARYAVNSWPTIFLADADGRPYARTKDYRPGGPDAYLKHLNELQVQKSRRDELFAAAAKAKGAERARLLDRGVQLCGDFIPIDNYRDIIDEIITADADNEAGLKMRWQTRRATDALENALPILGKAGKWDDLVAEIDTFLERYEPSPAVRQKALYWRGSGQARLRRLDDAKKSLEAAVAIDPKAEFGQRSKKMLERLAGRGR